VNEIEEKFSKAFDSLQDMFDEDLVFLYLHSQVVIGIYVVDFIVNGKYIIEIDGHEWHKTKEQREFDYKRERYLLKRGYTVLRYTGTEIYLSAKECAKEARDIILDLMKGDG